MPSQPPPAASPRGLLDAPRRDADLDALVVAHLPLVGHCVGEVMSRVPAHVDRDDLAGAGVDSRARATAETTEHLTAVLGRTPRTDEVADALGVDAGHVHRVRAETHRSYLTSLEETQTTPDGSRAVHDSVRDPGMSPEEHVVLAEHVGRLRRAVDLLPERVREAVRGHYLDEEPMAAIAARLGVTESRVSQLRAEGVTLLRQVLADEQAADATSATSATSATRAATATTAPSPVPAGVLGSLPLQGTRRPGRREAAYAAAVAAAADSRTSIGVGSAVLAGAFVTTRAAATG